MKFSESDWLKRDRPTHSPVTASFSQNAVLFHEGGNKYNAAMNMLNSWSMGLLLCLCSIIVAQPQNVGKLIESIELRGTRDVPADSLKPLLKTKVGDVYNAEVLGRDAAALWETGWFSAIELKPEPGDAGGMVVRFVVSLDRDRPQSVSVIDAIEVRGVKGIPDDRLKGLITVKAGDVYNEQALGRDLAGLWASGMFSDIQLRKDRGSSGGVVIRFALTEPQ